MGDDPMKDQVLERLGPQIYNRRYPEDSSE